VDPRAPRRWLVRWLAQRPATRSWKLDRLRAGGERVLLYVPARNRCAGDPSVSDNVIEYNVVTTSTGLVSAGLPKRVGISDHWDSRAGVGNVFRFNDVHNNPGGIAQVSAVALQGNPVAASAFVSALRHDRRVVRIGCTNALKIHTP
jgi:hypothetical protein